MAAETAALPAFEPYASRPWQADGVSQLAGWQLKRYRVWYAGRERIDWQRFTQADALLQQALPQPAQTAQRIGAGFVIAHAGRGVDYLLLNWWDNENEWRHRVWIRALQPGADWQLPQQGESACVWDLALIQFEREAYVDWLLGRRGHSLEQYLATFPAPNRSW